MRLFGTALFVLGLVILIAGALSGIAAPGSSTVNLGLMDTRALIAGIGSTLMICGAIFIVGGALMTQQNRLATSFRAHNPQNENPIRPEERSTWNGIFPGLDT